VGAIGGDVRLALQNEYENEGDDDDDVEDIASEVGIGGVGRPRGVRHERGPRRNPRGEDGIEQLKLKSEIEQNRKGEAETQERKMRVMPKSQEKERVKKKIERWLRLKRRVEPREKKERKPAGRK